MPVLFAGLCVPSAFPGSDRRDLGSDRRTHAAQCEKAPRRDCHRHVPRRSFQPKARQASCAIGDAEYVAVPDLEPVCNIRGPSRRVCGPSRRRRPPPLQPVVGNVVKIQRDHEDGNGKFGVLIEDVRSGVFKVAFARRDLDCTHVNEADMDVVRQDWDCVYVNEADMVVLVQPGIEGSIHFTSDECEELLQLVCLAQSQDHALALAIVQMRAGTFHRLPQHLQENCAILHAALGSDDELRAEFLRTASKRELHEWHWSQGGGRVARKGK